MIELRSYDVEDALLDEQDDEAMLSGFMDYGGNTYICDAIGYLADDSVSIWNQTLCEQAWHLYLCEAYEEAAAQGLMGDGHDLIRNLQAAWYEYSTQQIYNNMDELCFNYAATYLNNMGVELDEDQEDELFERFKDYDHNHTFDDLLETTREVLDLQSIEESEDEL